MRANEVRTANRRCASLVPLWVNLCGLLIFGQSSCDAYRESRCTAKNVLLTIREACKYIMQNEFLTVRVFISCPAHAHFFCYHSWGCMSEKNKITVNLTHSIPFKNKTIKKQTQETTGFLQAQTQRESLQTICASMNWGYAPKMWRKNIELIYFFLSLSHSLSMEICNETYFFQQNNHLAWNPCVQMMWLFSVTYKMKSDFAFFCLNKVSHK